MTYRFVQIFSRIAEEDPFLLAAATDLTYKQSTYTLL